MKDRRETPIPVSDRALEMVMRDVLDGMLELSLESAYANGMEFQIVEIGDVRRNTKPRSTDRSGNDTPADILPFPPLRKAASG